MHDRCDKCNLKFSIEPGFFQGAAYVSYELQILSSLIFFNSFFWLTNILWQNIVYVLLYYVQNMLDVLIKFSTFYKPELRQHL